MAERLANYTEEVRRMRRVADLLCTAHACLRDKYSRRASLIDYGLLVLSAWMTCLAIIDPKFATWVTPRGMDPVFWIGILAFLVFSGVLFQFKFDWKGCAEAHSKSLALYAEVKRQAGYLLSTDTKISQVDFGHIATRYDMASEGGTPIPDSQFLKLKRKHLQKIAISKLLDDRPGLSLVLIRLKMFWKDNVDDRAKP